MFQIAHWLSQSNQDFLRICSTNVSHLCFHLNTARTKMQDLSNRDCRIRILALAELKSSFLHTDSAVECVLHLLR